MKAARNSVYIYVTWLSKAMAGEVTCEWQSWFKSHFRDYDKAPSDFDQPKWMMEHAEAVREVAGRLRAEGWNVTVEAQNDFKYRTKSGAIVAAKPDIVALKDGHCQIWDAKTGKQRASDSVQVMLYCLMGPHGCQPLEGFGGKIEGRIFYSRSGATVPVPVVDAAFIERAQSFVEMFSQTEPLAKAPGGDCAWCDIARSECPERIERQKWQRIQSGRL